MGSEHLLDLFNRKRFLPAPARRRPEVAPVGGIVRAFPGDDLAGGGLTRMWLFLRASSVGGIDVVLQTEDRALRPGRGFARGGDRRLQIFAGGLQERLGALAGEVGDDRRMGIG